MLEMWEPFLREKIFRARSALPQQYRVRDHIWWIVMIELW